MATMDSMATMASMVSEAERYSIAATEAAIAATVATEAIGASSYNSKKIYQQLTITFFILLLLKHGRNQKEKAKTN